MFETNSFVADSGQLGLAPTAPYNHPTSLIIPTLDSQNVIEKDKFAIYLKNIDSTLWLGGYDPDFIRTKIGMYGKYSDIGIDKQFVWFPISKGYSWSI